MSLPGYTDLVCSSFDSSTQNTDGVPRGRRPGRPPVYKFDRPDNELSENERRLKDAILKRRTRQNRSYHRKKLLRELQSRQEVQETKPKLFSLPPLVHSRPQLLPLSAKRSLSNSKVLIDISNFVLQPTLLQTFRENDPNLMVKSPRNMHN